jgi:hypothetical protein
MLAGQLTTVAAALFTGAAIYINVAEQPGRQALASGPMLAQWQASYRRAAVMQASLALIGGALAAWAAYRGADERWLLAALLLLANWPYTLLCIKPTNDILNRLPISAPGPDAARHMARWGHLHAGRSALGLAAVLACLWAGH